MRFNNQIEKYSILRYSTAKVEQCLKFKYQYQNITRRHSVKIELLQFCTRYLKLIRSIKIKHVRFTTWYLTSFWLINKRNSSWQLLIFPHQSVVQERRNSKLHHNTKFQRVQSVNEYYFALTSCDVSLCVRQNMNLAIHLTQYNHVPTYTD